MSLYDWLLFLHVTGAFLLIGGIVVAGVLNLAALGTERRPSEVALLYRLIQPALAAIGLGLVLTLALGLWLVHEAHYHYGDTWIVAALVLWVLVSAMGNIDGKRQRGARKLAERLAAEDDAPSGELRARLLDPAGLVLSYGSGLIALAVLGLMIWKPGA